MTGIIRMPKRTRDDWLTKMIRDGWMSRMTRDDWDDCDD